MALKSDVCAIFLSFQKNVERFFNCKIKLVQSNWDGEYRSLSKLLQNMGITHRLSCPYTHQQNSTIERKHSHIVEMGLALMSHAHVPLHFWDDAFQTTCYLINHLPTPILKNASPFETLFCTPLDYYVLRIFGCACWPNLCPYASHKLQPRSTQCIFMGYSPRYKGYKCLHLSSGRTYISHDGVFDENFFPFNSSISSTTSTSPQPDSPIFLQPIINPTISHTLPTHVEPLSPPSHDLLSSSLPHPSSSSSPMSNPFDQIVASLSIPPLNSHPILTRSKNQISKPKVFNDGTIRYPISHALIVETNSFTKPTCYTKVIKDPNWCQAMNLEFDALLKNQTWKLVPYTEAENVVGCKWVFRLKRKANCSIVRYKARLVAKGFHQQPGVDFSETYSPVVKPTTVRLLLSIDISCGWPIRQIDIQMPFYMGSWMRRFTCLSHPVFHILNIPIIFVSCKRLYMA
jgi:hypothetical protein